MGDAKVTSEQILRAVRRLVQYSTAHSKSIARDAGLTMPQLLCLRAVDELAPEHCTVARVAHYAGLSLPTASRLLTRLVDAGYLRREHVPRDRRKVFLALTAKGQDKLSGRIRTLQQRFTDHLARLDEEERQQLVSSLERLVSIMEAIRQNGEAA